MRSRPSDSYEPVSVFDGSQRSSPGRFAGRSFRVRGYGRRGPCAQLGVELEASTFIWVLSICTSVRVPLTDILDRFQIFIQVERIPLVHLVLVLDPLVLVLVSSSCNLENREREEESGGGAGFVGSSSTLYFCSNWFVLHRSPGSSIHNF